MKGFGLFDIQKKSFLRTTLLKSGAILLCIISTSCSREDGDSKDTSKISISLPSVLSPMSQSKVSTLSATTLTHVSISATADDMMPVYFQWDTCRSCLFGSTAPDFFRIEVPGGPNRLIQILAVYEGEGSTVFRYGDATLDARGGEVSLPILVSDVTSGSVVTGDIGGRYLSADLAGIDAGPTDLIDIYYQPPRGPAMVISTSKMINGWFRVFGLTGTAFVYRLRNSGEVLWGQPMSLDSFAVSSKLAKIYIPTHVRSVSHGGGIYHHSHQDAQINIMGYWQKSGATTNLSNRYICLDAILGSPTNLTKLFNYSASLPPPVSPNSNNPLQIVLGGAVPTAAELLSTATPYGYIRVFGGNDNAASPCNSLTPFQTKLVAGYSVIDAGNKDAVLGFDGIFQFTSPTNLIQVNWDSANTEWDVIFNLLPSTETIAPKIKIFKKSGFLSNQRIDRPDCFNQMPGWTLVGTYNTTPVLPISIPALANATGPGTALVACPYADAAATIPIPHGGKFFEAYNIRNIATVDAQWTPQAGNCYKMDVLTKDSSGDTLQTDVSGGTLTLSSQSTTAGTAITFYTDSGCAAGGSPTLTIPAYTNSGFVYAKISGSVIGSKARVNYTGTFFGNTISGQTTELTLSPP